jgi:hypothetical protein
MYYNALCQQEHKFNFTCGKRSFCLNKEELSEINSRNGNKKKLDIEKRDIKYITEYEKSKFITEFLSGNIKMRIKDEEDTKSKYVWEFERACPDNLPVDLMTHPDDKNWYIFDHPEEVVIYETEFQNIFYPIKKAWEKLKNKDNDAYIKLKKIFNEMKTDNQEDEEGEQEQEGEEDGKEDEQIVDGSKVEDKKEEDKKEDDKKAEDNKDEENKDEDNKGEDAKNADDKNEDKKEDKPDIKDDSKPHKKKKKVKKSKNPNKKTKPVKTNRLTQEYVKEALVSIFSSTTC